MMYQVNFLPWRLAQLHTRYRLWRNALLIQNLVVIVVASIIFGLLVNEQQRQRVALITLSQQQAKLRQAYELTNSKIIKLKKMQFAQQADQLAQLHNQRYLVLLRQLSLLMPDNCWITTIEERNSLLVLVAVSGDYAAIITFLQQLSEGSELNNTRLINVTKRNDSKYDFVIHADWKYRERLNE